MHFLATLSFCQFFGDFFQGDSNFQFMFNGQQMHQRCDKYTCPGTKTCVNKPVECPCPASQLKCVHGDWYYCLESKKQCEEINSLAEHYPKKSKK